MTGDSSELQPVASGPGGTPLLLQLRRRPFDECSAEEWEARVDLTSEFSSLVG
jgi:hypothetical protein